MNSYLESISNVNDSRTNTTASLVHGEEDTVIELSNIPPALTSSNIVDEVVQQSQIVEKANYLEQNRVKVRRYTLKKG